MFLYKNTTGCRWFPKAFDMPGSAAAAYLPLMRDVAKIGSSQPIFDGGRETRRKISPPVFCRAKSSPLVRGGQGSHLRWWGNQCKRRLCIPSARPVVMIIFLSCFRHRDRQFLWHLLWWQDLRIWHGCRSAGSARRGAAGLSAAWHCHKPHRWCCLVPPKYRI